MLLDGHIQEAIDYINQNFEILSKNKNIMLSLHCLLFYESVHYRDDEYLLALGRHIHKEFSSDADFADILEVLLIKLGYIYRNYNQIGSKHELPAENERDCKRCIFGYCDFTQRVWKKH